MAIWNINKKKPVLTVRNAHKKTTTDNADHKENGLTTNNNNNNNPVFMFDKTQRTSWISAVAAYRNSDLLASGSDDGSIRVWSFSQNESYLKELFQVQTVSHFFIN